MRSKYREKIKTIITSIVNRFILSNTTLIVEVELIIKLTILSIKVAIAKVYILRYGFLV